MRRSSRSAIIFACCLFAMPTCVAMLDGFQADSMGAALLMGALVGAVHVAARPIIRLLSAPIGCLTLGLIQPLIDIALLYLCAGVVDGFSITNPLHALLAVVLINSVCFIAGGRR
ncbi:MAG: phage holin family protein [Christensenellales bacterium]|jgi:putative membrane protein